MMTKYLFALGVAAVFLILGVQQVCVVPSIAAPPGQVRRQHEVGSDAPEAKIPHRLVFIYCNKNNDLIEEDLSTLKGDFRWMARNVRRSVGLYRAAWNESSAEAVFLTDDKCRRIIKQTDRRLYDAFDKETNGAHKSDICRFADLLHNGGYYLDNDLAVVKPPLFSPTTTLALVMPSEPQNLLTLFNPVFVAVAPRHPVVAETIQVMIEYYQGKIDPVKDLGTPNRGMGCFVFRHAYQRVVAANPSIAPTVKFLHEINLLDNRQWKPEIERDPAWRHWNHAILDLATDEMHFCAKRLKTVVS